MKLNLIRKLVVILLLLTTFLLIFRIFSNLLIQQNKLGIESWAYQLQNISLEDLIKSKFNLIVIDYSRNGSELGEFRKEEINLIKKSGKIVLAYISIGEAEDYRFYWKKEWYKNPPEFLGKENKEWKGNYAVKYWNSNWKEIVLKYLDRIIQQGFDGIYLDKVDAFEYWSNCNNSEDICLSEKEAAKRMINFIKEISDYCRKNKKNFIIIIQNGERLIEYDENKILLKILDGIAVEDLFYYGTKKIPENFVKERLKYLNIFKRSKKLILVVDYVDTGNHSDYYNLRRIRDFILRARRRGFIPYVAIVDRELDELNIIPGIQPP